MKLVASIISSALLLTSYSSTAQNEPTVLFDVEKHCRSVETTQGVRYLPPCSLPDSSFNFVVTAPNEDNDYNNGNLVVDFYCESLRPFTIDYQITQGQDLYRDSELVPSSDKDNAKSTFSLNESEHAYSFKLTNLNTGGFQAMKPGCKVTVSTSATEVVEKLPIALSAKVHLALWEASNRVLEKRYSIMFKERLIGARSTVESLNYVLSEAISAPVSELTSAQASLDVLINACSYSFCPSSVYRALESLHEDREAQLIQLKQALEALIAENENDQENLDKWQAIHAKIIETLNLAEDK